MTSLVTLVLAALVGSGFLLPEATRRLEARLRQEAGGAGSVQVRIEPDSEPRGLGSLGRVSATLDDVDAHKLPLAALVPVPIPRTPKGRIARIEFEATHVRLDLLKVSALRFAANDVAYDLATAAEHRELRVTALGAQDLTVLLRDGDLDEYAAQEYPELSDAHITFEHGQVVARAKVPVIFAAFPAEVRGKLVIEQNKRVLLKDATLNVGRLELSDELRKNILSRFDPLIDLDKTFDFPVPLTWTHIDVGDGVAVIHGRITTPPQKLEARPAFDPAARYR